jgi:AMP nucleosidase
MQVLADVKGFEALSSYVRGGLRICHSADEAFSEIERIYSQSNKMIRDAFENITENDEGFKTLEDATYPYLAFHVPPAYLNIDARIAYGAVLEPGLYGTTVTCPHLFESYYKEQMSLLIKHHRCPIFVGKSTWPIPLPFIGEAPLTHLREDELWQLKVDFAFPDLSKVDDSIANGTFNPGPGEPKPLALFTAERVDYSLHRLHHYCGTAVEHFQKFILLTNYQRYIDHFIDFSLNELKTSDSYTSLVEPGDVETFNPNFKENNEPLASRPSHLPQMPAYHLKRKDGNGITFINIGVGPTNAKTITDHLAVLRPHCWIMLGHCAGFRRSQRLGDYVLAHGYVRDDRVLDEDVPPWIPTPPIAEVQVALQEAVVQVTGLSGPDLKTRMRTGTVVSSDNRNWELRSNHLFKLYNQSRAIALDLESATLATNGFRFRVPYGTLLCVSDKPLHGELKLRGMASQFYKERVNQHMEIGLEAIRILRDRGAEFLHSRKLPGFAEPPFR